MNNMAVVHEGANPESLTQTLALALAPALALALALALVGPSPRPNCTAHAGFMAEDSYDDAAISGPVCSECILRDVNAYFEKYRPCCVVR